MGDNYIEDIFKMKQGFFVNLFGRNVMMTFLYILGVSFIVSVMLL